MKVQSPILHSTHHIVTLRLPMHHQIDLSLPPKYLTNGPHHSVKSTTAVLIQNIIISHLGTILPSKNT